MKWRTVLSALLLLGLLLQTFASVPSNPIKSRKASSPVSLLETKTTHKIKERTKYYSGSGDDSVQLSQGQGPSDDPQLQQQQDQPTIVGAQQQFGSDDPVIVDPAAVENAPDAADQPTDNNSNNNNNNDNDNENNQNANNDNQNQNTDSNARFQQRTGGFGNMLGSAIGGLASNLINGPNAGQPAGSNGRITGASTRVSNSDTACVACQFFVQTMVNSMSQYSTLFASMPTPSSQSSFTSYPPYYNPSAYRPLPSMAPYMGQYANRMMWPGTRMGMYVEEKAKVHRKSGGRQTGREAEREQDRLDSRKNALQTRAEPADHQGPTPPPYGTPRRFRASDMTLWRDRLNRIDTLNPPNPDPLREQARYLESQMFQAVYQKFEGLCASRVPEFFVPFCQPMLDKYHIIAQGLHYGDRPDQICMRNEFCTGDSYVQKVPHNTFKP